METDGWFEKCDPNANIPGVVEPTVEFIMDDDDNLFVNGTYHYHREIRKWPVKFYTQRYSEGRWVAGPFQRAVSDFCKVMHSPLEIWYNLFKRFKPCPIMKGTVWNIDMVKIELGNFQLPPSLEGRWRIFLDLFIEGDISDCYVKGGEAVNV